MKTAYGPFTLSFQASSKHSSSPQVDGLEPDQYTHVEVAIFQKRTIVGPEKAGVPQFAPYFDETGVAHFMPREILDQLVKAMESAHATA